MTCHRKSRNGSTKWRPRIIGNHKTLVQGHDLSLKAKSIFESNSQQIALKLSKWFDNFALNKLFASLKCWEITTTKLYSRKNGTIFTHSRIFFFCLFDVSRPQKTDARKAYSWKKCVRLHQISWAGNWGFFRRCDKGSR